MYNEKFQIKIIVLNRGYAKISNFSDIIALSLSLISSGKKERSISTNHLSFAFANLAKMLFITFSSNRDACIEITKSAFFVHSLKTYSGSEVKQRIFFYFEILNYSFFFVIGDCYFTMTYMICEKHSHVFYCDNITL